MARLNINNTGRAEGAWDARASTSGSWFSVLCSIVETWR